MQGTTKDLPCVVYGQNAVDYDVYLCTVIVTFGLRNLCRYIGLHRFFSSYTLPLKPLYDTISLFSLVRYNLVVFPCMIQSCSSFMYDIDLGATTTTTLGIRGVQIPINLVSSATDSIR